MLTLFKERLASKFVDVAKLTSTTTFREIWYRSCDDAAGQIAHDMGGSFYYDNKGRIVIKGVEGKYAVSLSEDKKLLKTTELTEVRDGNGEEVDVDVSEVYETTHDVWAEMQKVHVSEVKPPTEREMLEAKVASLTVHGRNRFQEVELHKYQAKLDKLIREEKNKGGSSGGK